MEEPCIIESMNKDTVINVEKALAKWNKHIFTYYPPSKKIVLSRYARNHMDGACEITDIKGSDLYNRIIEKSHFLKMFDEVDSETESISKKFSTLQNQLFRISMYTIAYDDNHKPLCTLGLLEYIEEDSKLNNIVSALIHNFNSVYYVDVDNQQVYPYKINPAVKSMLNSSLSAIPLYSDLMKEYIEKRSQRRKGNYACRDIA